jgi:hypothetical protein
VTQHPAQEAVLASTPGAQVPARLAELERTIRVALQQLGWVAARGYRAAALSIAGYTRVPLDAVSFGGGYFSGGNYVAPIAGKYQALAQAGGVLPNTTGDNTLSLAIARNGSVVSYGTEVTAPADATDVWARVIGGDVIECAAGDTLELWVYFTGGDGSGALLIEPGTESDSNFLAVARVG